MDSKKEVCEMKKMWSKLVDTIKNQDYTSREAVLSALVLFLLGIVLGTFFSPKKNTQIGSNNGNNNVGSVDAQQPNEGEAE